MNQLQNIQQKIQEKKKRLIHEPIAQSMDNLRMGRLSVPLEQRKKKGKKQDYIVLGELELLNELSLQPGF